MSAYFRKISSYRSVIIGFFIIFSSTSVNITQASAQEICFSNVADSAWSNGEPKDLNREGISSRFIFRAPSDFLFRYQNVPVQFTYQYLGNNCALRIVNIDYVYNPSFQELTIDEFIEAYKSSSRNLFSVEERVASLRSAASAINGSQLTLTSAINSKGYLEWNSNSKMLNGAISKLTYDGFPSSKFEGPVRPLIEIDSSCGYSENALDDRSYVKYLKREFFGVATFNAAEESPPPILFQISRNICTAKVFLVFGSTPKRGESSGFTIQALENPLVKVNLGDVAIIAKVSSRKTSIICTKGKTTKKVTGVNPQCPSGYKKK